MTAIPSDIMEAASKAHEDQIRADIDDEPLVIARALAAERRRCALIARKWQESPHKDEKFAANSIADKIMAGAE